MKVSFFRNSVAGALAALLMVGPAFAAAQSTSVPASPVSLKGDVKLEKTVTENGKSSVQLLEPKVVVPGDHLLFTTRYHNDGAQAVTNFVVTNPLPSAVLLAPDETAANEVSVDGGKTWGLLAALKVSDGKGGTRAAAPGDVTHVRWTIAAIAPGAAGEVEYHAIVR
jgi:uncharacterized repeat protein (TIGR01451 family)